MGRFSKLLAPSQAPKPAQSPLPTPEKVLQQPASDNAGKPASPQNHSPTKPDSVVPPSTPERTLPRSPTEGEIPEKYTTRLRPSMIRHLKIFAVERDMNDYEVVEKALTEYFKRIG